MKGDLFINGNDAHDMGIAMGSGFLGNLLSPAALKDFVENDDPTKNGKEVLIRAPKIAPRDLSLNFVIFGSTPSEHMQRYNAFITLLQKGNITIAVPEIGSDVYKLIYSGTSSGYTLSADLTISNIIVKFEEPNPTDRA